MNWKLASSIALVSAAAMSVPQSSLAAYYEFTNTVFAVGTAAPDLWGNFDYLLLNGVSSAGNCVFDGGKLLVLLPQPKAYATALSAHAAGKQVMVSLDDTRRDPGGYCILRWMKVLE
jgi:hypothetical protein